jgi:aryl-alcohol dehydrogenase-like predicted oxidoreductase
MTNNPNELTTENSALRKVSSVPRATTITLGGDLQVGRIGYGAMRLTGTNLWGEYADRDGGIALLRQAVEAGVTLIDTADVYGPHTNELLIREALHPYPEHLVIATKGGFVRGGFDRFSTFDAIGNANYLRQCAYMSARRLGVEQIDLYYLHSGYAKDASFEDQVGTLAELRQQGLIRHIGLSNVTPDQLRAARQIVDIAAVTAYFNVVARQEGTLLDAALEAGAVFVPWQPVSLTAPGLLPTDTGGPEAVRRVLEPIASRHGATISQIALAWLLARSPAIMPCPGTTSIAHLRENLDAQDIELSREDIQSINSIAPERTATQSLPSTPEPRSL